MCAIERAVMDAYDKTSIQINRCKRILALVDTYVETETASARTDLRKALMEEFEAPAIAPPVAAGSVDTMQRYDLTMSWGETVMEDCTSGDWVRHDDAIAWNAQECERAKNASSNCIKINEELIQEQRRAEKAELLLSSVAALAHKWNKDAVNDGFAASEPGMEILELLGWPKE